MQIKEGKVALHFPINEDLHKKIKEKADELGISMASVVRLACIEYLKEKK